MNELNFQVLSLTIDKPCDKNLKINSAEYRNIGTSRVWTEDWEWRAAWPRVDAGAVSLVTTPRASTSTPVPCLAHPTRPCPVPCTASASSS